MKFLPFFILAGGYGQRAQPLSFIKPKPVFPLDGTPLIRIMLQRLMDQGLEWGFINLHYMPEAVRACVETMPTKPAIHFLYEQYLSGSRILAQSLKWGDHELLLVTNGDCFLEIPVEEMLRALQTGGADGVILVRPNKEQNPAYKAILTGKETETDFFKGRMEHRGVKTAPGTLMYTGTALFTREALSKIDDTNLFDSLEKYRLKIKTLLYDGTWLDIGDPRSYRESNFIYKNYIRSPGSNSLSENVTISSDSNVKNSIIWENTEIKNHTRLSNCIVTGNTILDHLHSRNSIIIEGEKVSH